MRSKYLLVLCILAVGPAMAATLTVTIPATAVVNATLRCQELRQVLRVRSSEWNNNACATAMTRLGLRQFNATQQEELSRQEAKSDMGTTLSNFDADWPGPTKAICGDGIADTEEPFNEACDDAGDSATCNGNCTTSVCGDGYLNTTAGEQCDDGNTGAGDGCSATCQTE